MPAGGNLPHVVCGLGDLRFKVSSCRSTTILSKSLQRSRCLGFLCRLETHLVISLDRREVDLGDIALIRETLVELLNRK
jgi:hypothetical protein